MHNGTKSETNIIDLLKDKEYDYIELCHRLDKSTSGCVILAKNNFFLKKFNKLIADNKVKKEYHAIIKGHLNTFELKIKTENKLNLYNKKINDKNKESITIIKTLNFYKKSSLIKIYPKTGRLHQIRIHLAHIGYPIANDEKYGNKTFNNEIKKYGISRMILHAKAISFICPITKKYFKIESNYDYNIQKLIKGLNNE